MTVFINFWFTSLHSARHDPSVSSKITGVLTIVLLIIILILCNRAIFAKDHETLDLPETRKRLGNLYLNLHTYPNQKLSFFLAFFI